MPVNLQMLDHVAHHPYYAAKKPPRWGKGIRSLWKTVCAVMYRYLHFRNPNPAKLKTRHVQWLKPKVVAKFDPEKMNANQLRKLIPAHVKALKEKLTLKCVGKLSAQTLLQLKHDDHVFFKDKILPHLTPTQWAALFCAGESAIGKAKTDKNALKAVRAHFPDKLADYTRATTVVKVPKESSALNFLRSRIEKVEKKVEKFEAAFKAFGEDHFEELLVRFKRARSEERIKGIINENRNEIETFFKMIVAGNNPPSTPEEEEKFINHFFFEVQGLQKFVSDQKERAALSRQALKHYLGSGCLSRMTSHLLESDKPIDESEKLTLKEEVFLLKNQPYTFDPSQENHFDVWVSLTHSNAIWYHQAFFPELYNYSLTHDLRKVVEETGKLNPILFKNVKRPLQVTECTAPFADRQIPPANPIKEVNILLATILHHREENDPKQTLRHLFDTFVAILRLAKSQAPVSKQVIVHFEDIKINPNHHNDILVLMVQQLAAHYTGVKIHHHIPSTKSKAASKRHQEYWQRWRHIKEDLDQKTLAQCFDLIQAEVDRELVRETRVRFQETVETDITINGEHYNIPFELEEKITCSEKVNLRRNGRRVPPRRG